LRLSLFYDNRGPTLAELPKGGVKLLSRWRADGLLKEKSQDTADGKVVRAGG